MLPILTRAHLRAILAASTMLTPVATGCLGGELEEPESSAAAATDGDPTQARRATRLLEDSQRTAEARDLDGDGVNDPPQYDVYWEASDEQVGEHQRLYGSVRRVTVTVDVDYPRADAVGIWLGVDGHEVQLRAPEYYTGAQSSYRQTFATDALRGQRAFGNVTLRIAGTELAVARDCWSDVSSTSTSASASNRGVFRSSSWSVSQSASWTTRRCQEFFRPLSIRNARIAVEYDVPPMAMPTYEWSLGLNTAYTNDTKWFEVEVPSSVPPPYVMSGIDVSMLIWHPASMGDLTVALVRKDRDARGSEKRVEIWKSGAPAAEGDDYVRIDTRIHAFDEERMDATWRLELIDHGGAAPGTTYELKNALIVLNTPARGPVVWRSTAVAGVESPHPFYVGTSQSWNLAAPEGAISCRLVFDRVEFEHWSAELTVLGADGTRLGRIFPPRSGSSVTSEAYPGGTFQLTFTTKNVSTPRWGFHLSELLCKY